MGTTVRMGTKVLMFIWVLLFRNFIATISMGTSVHRVLVNDGYLRILPSLRYGERAVLQTN